jgi:hypothetical protein
MEKSRIMRIKKLGRSYLVIIGFCIASINKLNAFKGRTPLSGGQRSQ